MSNHFQQHFKPIGYYWQRNEPGLGPIKVSSALDFHDYSQHWHIGARSAFFKEKSYKDSNTFFWIRSVNVDLCLIRDGVARNEEFFSVSFIHYQAADELLMMISFGQEFNRVFQMVLIHFSY